MDFKLPLPYKAKKGRVRHRVDPIVVNAIQAQVDREDLLAWAHTPPMPLPEFEPLPKLKLTPTSAFVLGRQMIKRSISIMTP